MTGPAWNYILFRGRFTSGVDNLWTRFFTPKNTVLIFVAVCYAVEVAQYLDLYEATFDPWDSDSAQFSTAVSELADAQYVGTALTVQTALGFLLTLITIRATPALVESAGWHLALASLAAGPVFGIWSMSRLRKLPEAGKMASGNR